MVSGKAGVQALACSSVFLIPLARQAENQIPVPFPGKIGKKSGEHFAFA